MDDDGIKVQPTADAGKPPRDAERPSIQDLLATLGLATLGEGAPPEAIDATLHTVAEYRRQNGTDPLFDASLGMAVRRAWHEAGVDRPASLWDATTPQRHTDGDDLQGQALDLSDVEPWPERVDGAELLAELARVFARFLILPRGAATALALWVGHTYAAEASFVSPFIVLRSPEKRCGKTRTFDVLRLLVRRALAAAKVSPAALYRSIEKYAPTLLVDEADRLGDNDELRRLLNAGHSRTSAYVVVTVGEEHEARQFSVFGPKAIALIGKLPDTLTDRAIAVPMRRRKAAERVERFREDRAARELAPLRRRVARWARDHVGALRDADPDVPGKLNDRAADSWRPLLAIADLAGGPWPERARTAAVLLSGDAADEDAPGELLLADVRALFEERGADRLASTEIVDALAKREDRPWPEWRQGKPLTVRQLARLLERFEIRPGQLWVEGQKIRGYDRGQFEDAWARYLDASLAQEGGSDPVGPVEPKRDKASSPIRDPVGGGVPTGSKIGGNPLRHNDPTGPTGSKGGSGPGEGSAPGLDRSIPPPDELEEVRPARPEHREPEGPPCVRCGRRLAVPTPDGLCGPCARSEAA